MNKQLLFTIFALCTLFMTAQGDLGIVGPAANGWPDDVTNPDPDIILTNNGDGTHFIAALTLNTGAAKFRTDMDWGNPNYGADAFPLGNISSDDINVVAGVYDILVDLNTNLITFTDVAGFTDIEVVGTGLFNGGTPQMASIDGVSYALSVTQLTAGTIEFREVGTSVTYGAIDFPAGTATQGGAAIPTIDGFYKITFDLTTGAYLFAIPSVGLVGPGAGGWPDANNITDIAMNTTDGDVYTLDAQTLTDDQVKFRQDQSWDVNWGGTAFPSGSAVPGSNDNIVAISGIYDIVFSRSNLTYAFTTTTNSLNDGAFSQFKVYPNPTSGSWFFENPTQSIKSIVIYDNLGKLVFEAQPNTIRGEVNTAVFAQGLYIAQVNLIDGSQTTVKLYKN
jgi:hypothetical protein